MRGSGFKIDIGEGDSFFVHCRGLCMFSGSKIGDKHVRRRCANNNKNVSLTGFEDLRIDEEDSRCRYLGSINELLWELEPATRKVILRKVEWVAVHHFDWT
ncbi:hypothetical protein Goarm_003795, partial [Gossypium armourianum]|nr:hypothetical protein [Gossypium armourianum]